MVHVNLTAHQISDHILCIPVPTATLPPESITNSYVIFDGPTAVVVDAGTADTSILDDISVVIQQAGVTQVQAVVATHWHQDHTLGIPHLCRQWQAPVIIHPMDAPNAARLTGCDFPIVPPPKCLHIGCLEVSIDHVPGHTHGHLHIAIQPDNVVLVGDHLTGSGTVWIGPPDGHMTNYFQALQTIMDSDFRVAAPGHGKPIEHPSAAAEAFLNRRKAREQEILDAVTTAGLSVAEIVRIVYRNRLPREAEWAAKRTAMAHLQRLMELGLVERSLHNGEFLYQAHHRKPIVR